jgi:hypothetical protein
MGCFISRKCHAALGATASLFKTRQLEALADTADKAREREAFGKTIIEQQAVAFRLATWRPRSPRRAAWCSTLRRDAMPGEPCIKEASMAKLFASEMAERVASDAIQIHGGYGYLADFPVERIYRDVRVCQIYQGTSDIQRLVIAREIAKN